MFENEDVYIVDGPLGMKLPPYAVPFTQPGGFRLTGPYGHVVSFTFADVEKDIEERGEWLQLHTTDGLVRLRMLKPDDMELVQLDLTIPELHEQIMWGGS